MNDTDAWNGLYALRAGGYDPPAARAQFAAALSAFHTGGWSYRELGRAIGMSHETVRLLIQGLPESTPTSRIPVPRRSVPAPPPPEAGSDPELATDPALAAGLNAALEAAVAADGAHDRTASGLRRAVADYFAALHAASVAGWDIYALAEALDSHPKAVFKFIRQHSRYGEGTSPDAPAPRHAGAGPVRRTPEPEPLDIPDRDAVELRRLEKAAYGDPPTESGLSDYQQLLGQWYLRGASRSALEQAAGQKWETLRKRLARAGFMAASGRTDTR